MPEATYTTVIPVPHGLIWDFVKDMNNWAPFMMGYQEHEVIDQTDSVWTLKGDVGVLSRKVKFRVHITEWTEPSRVAFTMTGVTDQMQGEGQFELSALGGGSTPASVQPARRSLLDRFLRWLYHLFNPGSSRREQPAAAAPGSPLEGSQLTFRLKLASGGMVGPVVDAMIEPLLKPAVEDIANKIAEHVEAAGPAGHVR
jgi:carbon monoxide dehydrogenase subunit G